jgi:tRNA 2-selenouridine synthase
VPTALPIDRFLAVHAPLIDVRSPGEYVRGHIPGAFNIPLFSDEERALVGTLYKQQGRNAATLEGLRLVGPKMADIVERAWALAPDGQVRVHCWRGGERSASVAWLLEKAGFTRAVTLVRGYKAFREHVLASFQQPRAMVVLGGYTGTGKTHLLEALRQRGEPVIDLEALACHKGSSFGGIGQKEQPTTEQFENLLWSALASLDAGQCPWLEDESQMIGRVKVPDAFFARMRQAPLFFVDMPQGQRAHNLVADYGEYPANELAEAIRRIRSRLGPQHAKEALEALEAGDLHRVASISLVYYDKTYTYGMQRRDPASITRIPATGANEAELAQQLIDEHHRKFHRTPHRA